MGGDVFGGPEEIRTPDPYNANVMRSQLRYGPMCSVCRSSYYMPLELVCQGGIWRIGCVPGRSQNARKERKFFVSFFQIIRLKQLFPVWYITICINMLPLGS